MAADVGPRPAGGRRRGQRGAARSSHRKGRELRGRPRQVRACRRHLQRVPSHLRARCGDGEAVIGAASRAADADAPRQLAWLSLAMFLGMTLWFSATAANGPIVAEFHLTPGETAWLTMAVQAGFV